MAKLLTLEIGGYGEISAPGDIPTGGIETGSTILRNGITILLIFTTIFALFMLIWGGITWITSNGDKAKVEAARKKLMYAIIGLIVAFLSFFIINTVGNLFGVSIFSTADPVCYDPQGNYTPRWPDCP